MPLPADAETAGLASPPLRGFLLPAVFALAFLAVLAPIAVSLMLAHHQSFVAEQEKARTSAQEILRRADDARAQMLSAASELDRLAAPPCSAASIARMASVVLKFEQLQGAGYIAHDSLICTSAGMLPSPIALGRVAFNTRTGYGIRRGVRLPFAPEVGLIVINAKSGYATFLHPRLSLDIPLSSEREALGVITLSNRRLINGRGPVDTRLIAPYFTSGKRTFVVDGRLVAVAPSARGDYAGFAILPMDGVSKGLTRYVLFLLPIGMICGGALVLLLRIVVRAENSFTTTAKRALASDQFYLHYQPLVELETGRWVGAEALVRWRRPTGENVRPDLFIPHLEEAGLIEELTDKVFALVAEDAGPDLCRLGDFYITINVASADLHGNRLARLIEALLRKTGCGGHQFAIEVTERGLIDARHGEALQAARAAGLRVALDDFGTGYCSLAYLQQFSLDCIKIDKAFIDSIAAEAATSSVVAHIINMAHDLQLALVAEGVETEEQARFLRDRGVLRGQGWLFARAMPWATLMSEFVKRTSTGRWRPDPTTPDS